MDDAPPAESTATPTHEELLDAIAGAEGDELDELAARLELDAYPHEADVEERRAFLSNALDAPLVAEPVDDGPSIEERAKALDKEETRHRKALAKALDVDEAELHECPTCEGVGYTPELIDEDPALQPDPFLSRCERCNGTGEVLTGAQKLANWKVVCTGCAGQGYVQRSEYPDVQPVTPNGPPQPQPAPTPQPVGVNDHLTLAEARAQGYVVVDPTPPPAPVSQ